MEYQNLLAFALKWAIAAGVLSCIMLWSYRTLLHPLHNYPGPRLARLTEWYSGYQALRMRTHLMAYEDHQRYGDVVRCAPNKLVFNTVEAFQDIYHNDRLIKARNYLVTRILGHYSVFTARDRKLHSHKRKIVRRAVSEKSMREFEPIMMKHIDNLIKQLEISSQHEDSTNMTTYYKRDSKYRWIIQWMEICEVRNNTTLQSPTITWIGLDIPFYLMKFVYSNGFLKMIRGLIARRLERGRHARQDFFAFMLDSKDPFTGNDTTMKEFLEEALFFFPAGGDTTSAALCALFFYLSRYSNCLNRLVEEIDSTFKNATDVRSGPELSGCKYLRACIDEAMRLSPPVPGTLWRELPTTDHEPLIIDGHVVPKGTLVGVNIYSLHHNAKYFPDPFVFKPERWLSTEKSSCAEKVKLANAAFAPFSTGSRGCAGKAMAYMEASLVACKTLLTFDIERASGRHAGIGGGQAHMSKLRRRCDEFQLYDHFSSSHDGPYLKLRRRDRSEKCNGA